MDTVVRVEGDDTGKFEESEFEKFSSTPTSPNQIADSVVYKLVRVEGDGRFVPATDEEVMEVADLLENDKSTVHIVADSGKTVACISNDGSSSGKSLLESSEVVSDQVRYPGLSQPANTEVDAAGLNARLEESLPSLSPNINDSHIYFSGSLGECSNPPKEPLEYGSSPSSDCPSQKPDFSKLEGEICLDNLTIRELHDTFKATFGRETTVKDKMWLKRRIAMGLTNSCDVSTTTFIYRDNKLVREGEEVNCKSMNHSCTMVPEDGAQDDCCEVSPVYHSNQMEDHLTVSAKRLRNYHVEYACGGEDVQNEPITTKRVRKPTRRYIEELSESDSVEHSGRLIATSRYSILGQYSPRSSIRPVKNVSSDGRAVITRLDSLGGSGVQIPCVSRIRRSRPRKNIMSLMRFHLSGSGLADEDVKKAVGVYSSEPANENENRVMKAGYTTDPIEQLIIAEQETKTHSVVDTIENAGPKHSDSSGETSDDNIATVPTAKGGMRRKHHRAWTLSEVMKLVEGVSRYGAGRWSEIKRLAFASYSHRTSVDLKDKWRNLLKASFAQTPPDKGINSRKNASMPIPGPILLRVRELAEMHAPNVGPNKIAGCGGRSLHETKSGFL